MFQTTCIKSGERPYGPLDKDGLGAGRASAADRRSELDQDHMRHSLCPLSPRALFTASRRCWPSPKGASSVCAPPCSVCSTHAARMAALRGARIAAGAS